MEIEHYLKDELGFEPRPSNKKEPPTLPFLPNGPYQEFLRGKWSIKVLDHFLLEERVKVGIILQVNIRKEPVVLFKGFINKSDSVNQLKRLLLSCTDLLSVSEIEYPCERVNIKYTGSNFHERGFIQQYYLWDFEDLLSSTVPPGFNVLVPEDIPVDECIDFINNYLLNIGSPSVGKENTGRIRTFNKSYISHFNSVGVNVLDIDSQGRMFIQEGHVKDTRHRLKDARSVYIVRQALLSILENRQQDTIEFFKETGLVRDMIIGRTIHDDVRISFLGTDGFESTEVDGQLEDLVRYFRRKFGNL